MKILDTLSQPWAIEETSLSNIIEITRSHMTGPKLDLKAMEEKLLSFTGDFSDGGYEVKNGTAIIPIVGTISKKPSAFQRIYYGARDVDSIKSMFLDAVNDSAIRQIIFHMDTPGGTTPGVQEFANTIYANRGKKPIIAFSDNQVASAGIWIASACDKILISGGTVATGSIGVYTSHFDSTEMDKNIGIKTTLIYAGKYKVSGHPDKKLSATDKDYIQDRVDYLYSLFTADIAKFRGVAQEKVLLDMADGRIFIGQQGIDAGLVDGVSSIERLISDGNDYDNKIKADSQAGGVQVENIETQIEVSGDETEIEEIKNETEVIKMEKTLDEILAENPKAQSEYNEKINSVKAEEKTASQQVLDRAMPFLKSDSGYPDSVRNTAADVVAGKLDVGALDAAVAAVDAVREEMKSKEAQTETEATGETPGETSETPSTDGSVKNQVDFQASVDRMKAGLSGVGV